MLWKVHEGAIRNTLYIVTYDASFQRHSIVREFVNKLNIKLIILERDKYADLDSIVIFTLLAWISGAGKTPLTRVALQSVRNILRNVN